MYFRQSAPGGAEAKKYRPGGSGIHRKLDTPGQEYKSKQVAFLDSILDYILDSFDSIMDYLRLFLNAILDNLRFHPESHQGCF